MRTYEITCPPGSLLELKDNGPTMVFHLSLGGSVRELTPETSPCWCQHPPENRFKTVFVVPPKHKPIAFDVEFCPKCGKKLND